MTAGLAARDPTGRSGLVRRPTGAAWGMTGAGAGHENLMATTAKKPSAASRTQRTRKLSRDSGQDTKPTPEPMLDPDWIDALLRSRNPSVLRA